MSTKSNPGRFNCYAAAFPDETIFTILARDPAFPATVEFWVSERIRLGKNETDDDKDRLSGALEEAKTAAAWREANLDPFGDGVPTWRVKMGFSDETSKAISIMREDPEKTMLRRLHALADDITGYANREVPVCNEEHGFALEAMSQYGDRLRALLNEIDPPILITRLLDGTAQPPEERPVRMEPALAAPYGGDTEKPETMEKVLVDTAPSDIAHSPEVPPHRFSIFHKGEKYAYARGLEINPSHLPKALDAMAADGWNLLAIFGQTDSQHVGFIFQRQTEIGLSYGINHPEEEAILEALRDKGRLHRLMVDDQPFREGLTQAKGSIRRHLDAIKPEVPEGMDAEIEVHITATRQAHADDVKGWLFSRLCNNDAVAAWPVNARVICLIDGQPERAFDIRVGPMHNCLEWDRGRGLEP